MTNSDVNLIRETVSRGEAALNHPGELPAIIRQIRLCRSTLGAILEELECGDRNPDTIERIADCATDVTAEIGSLWDATKPAG